MTTGHDRIVPLSTRVPKNLLKRIRLAALQAEMKVQDVVRQALEEWLIRHGY